LLKIDLLLAFLNIFRAPEFFASLFQAFFRLEYGSIWQRSGLPGVHRPLLVAADFLSSRALFEKLPVLLSLRGFWHIGSRLPYCNRPAAPLLLPENGVFQVHFFSFSTLR